MSDASSLAINASVSSGRSSLCEMSVDSEYEPSFSLGMRLDVKELYRPNDRSPWADSVLAETTKHTAAASYAQECALIVRRERDPLTHRGALHSITVQTPLVKEVLDRTFEGYDGLNTRLSELTFSAPFYPFYHRWHRFERLCREEQDQKVKGHLNLLYNTLSDETLPHVETMSDLVKNEVISFDYLWTIFTPGMQVYTTLDGQDQVLEVNNTRYSASMRGEFFDLDCRYIDCDGLSFGYVSCEVNIDKFEGVKKITDLDGFPFHLHPDIRRLVTILHRRGVKLEQMNGLHHMSYSGPCTARSSRQMRKRQLERSRIIIDPQGFATYGPSGPGLGLIEAGLQADSGVNDSLADARHVIYSASSQAFHAYEDALERHEKENSVLPSGRSILTAKQHMLCSPIIRGFCLPLKTWAEFYVDNVCSIAWNENAFPRLVLPSGYKEVIHAFLRQQLARDDGFDDIVQEKGLGFIMLLSGEPGVGKTLTVEAVAEEMRQPLYMMNASELGETVTQVEESLEQVLELANKWNAILLLDECDLFLEARSISDIRRSHLVSVFLRQLEYYQGVLFLTSNRISDSDPAFESRIHLTIHYPPLDIPSRLHIWKNFVDTTGSENQLSSDDLESLAKTEMNGREIRNIVKTARLLAKQAESPLAMGHIERVLKIRQGVFE